jgi:hypothetical protein
VFTRWKITALPSELPDRMTGVGFPGWNVELLKVRNDKHGHKVFIQILPLTENSSDFFARSNKLYTTGIS